MIQIDKNIPIPPRNRQGRNDDKYPIRDLDVGDSFIMPAKNTNTASGYVRAAAKRLGDGRKFTVRKTEDGIRVWRIA